MKLIHTLTALLVVPLTKCLAAEHAQFIVPAEVIIRHTPERSFIGPGMFVLDNGDVLMAAPWGRSPTNVEQIAAKFPVPMLYRSIDGGRTWKESGRMKMEWNLTGLISDGGTSFLRLRDRRLAVVFNRHVRGLHGGGTPVIAFSADDGNTWTAAKLLVEDDDAFYVMNDRLIQLRTGRLVLPVARKVGKNEGDQDEGLAMLSDDAGATWRLSQGRAALNAPRGMAEPCVAELGDGRVIMLARTGLGSLHAALSADGGETWSAPEATTLESACSSLTLKILPDGRLIVFYNHATPIKAGAFFPRTPLCYAVSGDGGKTWSPPVTVDDEGAVKRDRQNIYPSICFTKDGMLVMWSSHGADPKGSFAGQYDARIGGGKRAILAMPATLRPKTGPPAGEASPPPGPSHVIVPHSQEAARNGEASLIELRDNSLLLMYGAHHRGGDWDRGEIRQMRSHDAGKTWSAPETVFSDARRSLFQVALTRLANGDLGLTHTSLGHGRDAFKVFRRSTDDGLTWSEPLKISDDSHEYTTGPWDKLHVLASGRVIALLHCRTRPDAKKQGGPLAVYTVYSDDHGKSWTRSPPNEVLHVPDNPLKKPEWGFWEPALVEHAPGKLLMLARTTTGWLWESRSEDGGTTWSPPVQSSVPNPVAPPVLTLIPDTGTLVLVHNPDVRLSDNWHGGERIALAFRTSRDSGRTWSPPTDIYRATDTTLWVDYPAVRWIKGQLHLVWRHIARTNPNGGLGGTSLYHHVLPREAFEAGVPPKKCAEPAAKPLRILPLGDSITRGSYLAHKDGTATGLPHPMSGGWRKTLQDKLRSAGIAHDFVGELNYAAFGENNATDPQFDPDHHGLAGFSNTNILNGGIVPTPADVLAALGVKEIRVAGLVEMLEKHQPDIILLMSGANGFDAPARDHIIRTIGERSGAHLFVATILPQKAPRIGWNNVDDYNASLPAIVAAQKAAGKRITLVEMHAAVTTEDLLPDGVHPTQGGMEKMAATWFSAISGSTAENR